MVWNLDSSGNIYVGGTYYGGTAYGATTVHSTNGATTSLPAGPDQYNYNVYVMKINGAGVIQWAYTCTSNSGDPSVNDLAVSVDGYVYAVGNRCDLKVNGTNYPYNTTSYFEGYVLKSTTGGGFSWFGSTTGNDWDTVSKVCVDPSSNSPIITGSYSNATADINPGSGTTAPHNSCGQYVAKLGSDGNIVWYMDSGYNNTTYTGDDIYCIYADGSGNIYAGGFINTSYPLFTSADSHTTSGSGNSHFLIKLNSSGIVQWTKQFGTTDSYNDTLVGLAGSAGGVRLLASVCNNFDIDPGAGTTYAQGTSKVMHYYVEDWGDYYDVYNSAMAVFTFSSAGDLASFAGLCGGDFHKPRERPGGGRHQCHYQRI